MSEVIYIDFPTTVVSDENNNFYLKRTLDGQVAVIQTTAVRRLEKEKLGVFDTTDNFLLDTSSSTPEDIVVKKAKSIMLNDLGCRDCVFCKNDGGKIQVQEKPYTFLLGVFGLLIGRESRSVGERPLTVKLECSLRKQEIHAGGLPPCLNKDRSKKAFQPEFTNELPF